MNDPRNEPLFRKLGDKADHPMAKVFSAGMTEWMRAKDTGRSEALVIGAKERIDKAIEQLSRYVSALH